MDSEGSPGDLGAGRGAGTAGPLGAEFWLAILAGLLLRAWYFVDLSRQPWYGFPLVDARTYDGMALSILESGHPGAFFRPPLYPYLLAGLYDLFGHRPTPVVWLQFLLGLASLVPAYLLAVRWFGRRAAVVSVWIGAVYPMRIFFEGELLDVTVFTFLFLWGIWTLWQALEEGASSRFLLSGLLLGAAAITRPNLLIALPFVALGGRLAFRAPARRWLAPAVWWAAGIALAVLPTTVHNWRAEGAFIPVAANGGVNLYLGNRPGASGVTPVLPGVRWASVLEEPIRAGVHSLSGQDTYWYARAAEVVRNRPVRWLALLAGKSALFFGAAEPSNNKALAHFAGVSFPVRHYRYWYGALVSLAVVGLLAVRGRGALFLSWLLGGFAVSVVLFFVTERYRLPLVPLLAPAAAAGALALVEAVRAGKRRRSAALGGALVAAASLVVPDWFGAGHESISADFQMGQIHLMRREPDLALGYLQRARAAAAQDPDVLNSLGAAYFQKGDHGRAQEAYEAALSLGQFSEIWFNVGLLAETRGPEHRNEAARAYRRALEINPLEHRARANLEALLSGATGAPPPGS